MSANRCPDCNKFVSTEIEIENAEAEADNEGGITLTLSLNKNCADCGALLKTATIETEINQELLREAEWEDA